MQDGLISIIIPVYNAELFLTDCINSVMKQSYKSIEIILVNDGSTDRSKAICESIAETDGRITVINKENGGASSARNAGLNIAKGEYVAFVDSDDQVNDELMYERLHKKIAEANADICMCGYKELYTDYARIIRVPSEEMVTPKQLWQLFLNEFRRYTPVVFVPWNKLYRTDLIKSEDYKKKQIRFNEDLVSNNDVWFTTECCAVADNGITFIDFTPYVYNIENPLSLSKDGSYENKYKVLKNLERIMISALPESTDDITSTINCQLCVSIAIFYHRAIINRQKPSNKLKWRIVATILRNSKSMSERLSVTLMYFMPKAVYRFIYKQYCRSTLKNVG